MIKHNLINNKVFAIYLGGDDAHIKFGSWDKGAILGDLSMFPASENGYGALFTHLHLGGKELVLNKGIAQSIIFDPSTPFIYLPMADFSALSVRLNLLFSNFMNLDRDICDAYDG